MIYTKSFPIQFDPVPPPEALVYGPSFRATVLSDRLLRLEYDPNEQFDDRPSQAFWYRRLPIPKFSATIIKDRVEVETERLLLRYQADQTELNHKSFSILLKDNNQTWRYGMQDLDNLLGTARTLDEVDGSLTLENGLLSRSGWTVYDDSSSLVFNETGWLEERGLSADYKDLYFFGYGTDFHECLLDFRRVTGKVPLLPRWILGNWWSRYWAYKSDELLDLMDEFQRRQIPLSVCIIDMDWHITNSGNTSSGWTGYTWNDNLFPNPPAFIKALHERGLRTALNLHPAEGIHPHESAYENMAQRLMIDPQTEEPIQFNIADPEFTRAYFEELHHPLEEQGVDFWWLDWQQGRLSSLPGLDPLWWLNHLHFFDLGRSGVKRPFVFSRWGGLGNHRYPIGFSGDTHVTWESLSFQPYFTATAANVSYGWWSHDIGGHMSGIEDPELYMRWLQFGVFSPILRLHSTNNPFHERRPWGYDAEIERLARDAMQLRHALIPYLYSMVWRDHRGGYSLVRPMYHEYPQEEAAYHSPDQYLFGSELIAAPFITPTDSETKLSRQFVWLPDGMWFDFFNSDSYEPGWHVIHGDLGMIPVFAKAGAILPMAPRRGWGGVENPEILEIHAFPCANNQFDLYEDDNADEYSLTTINNSWSKDSWKLRVNPVTGSTRHLPGKRRFALFFHATSPHCQVSMTINGKALEPDTQFDQDGSTLTISPVEVKPQDTLEVQIIIPQESLTDYRLRMLRRMLHAFPIESWVKMRLDKYLPDLLEDPRGIADFELDMSERQMRSFLEVLCSAGIRSIPARNQTGDKLILWNNSNNPDISYRITARNLASRTEHKRGTLPQFGVLHQQRDILHVQLGDSRTARFNQATDWIEALPRKLILENIEIDDAIVQLNIAGQEGFKAYFKIQDGKVTIRIGEHFSPHVLLNADSKDFLRLVNGEASATDLYEEGKFHITGSFAILLKLYEAINNMTRNRFLADRWHLDVNYLEIFVQSIKKIQEKVNE